MHFLDTSDNRDGRIIQRREEDFDALVANSDVVDGVPSLYVKRGGDDLFEFDRTPTAEEVVIHPRVRVRYFRRIDNLATDTSTFSIGPEVEEFLIWHGRKELSVIYDAQKYPLAMQEANRAMLDLVRRDTIRDEQDWF